MNNIHYFAYGLNTNLDSMFRRCPGAEPLGCAALPDYEFRFATHADVIESPGKQVDGVLWRISDLHLQSLDDLEGYPTYYDRKFVMVEHQGTPVQALVYYMAPGISNALPPDSYLQMVIEGYWQNSVPRSQIYSALSTLGYQGMAYEPHRNY